MFSRKFLLGVLSGIAAVAGALTGIAQVQAATTYYVSKTGVDSGTTGPFASITYAIGKVAGNGNGNGNTISVNPGTYTEHVWLTRITNLTVTATTKGTAFIHGPANEPDQIVRIQGCSTITFSGLDVSGLDANNNVVVQPSCSGIAIGPRNAETVNHVNLPERPSYDIHITNNVVHDTTGSGIGAGHSDYIYFVGNTVYHTASNNIYNESAMGMLAMAPADTNTGYHNFIEKNRIRDNYNYTPGSGYHTDGNGIIIDTNAAGPETVIRDNVVYDNSGRGIYAFNSSNVDIINNTTYKNCIDPLLDAMDNGTAASTIGEIVVSTRNSPYNANSPYDDHNVNVLNNIVVAGAVTLPNGGGTYNPKTYVASDTDSTNTAHTFDPSVKVSNYNCYSGGSLNLVSIYAFPTTLPYISPIFYNASVGDFREYNSMGAVSATVNAGTNIGCSLYDFNNNPRPYTGDGVGIADLGAIEYGYN